MKLLCFTAYFFLSITVFSKPVTKIETSDIDRFWMAYDALTHAKSLADSVKIIQEQYIDHATPEFKKFLKVRNFTPIEYCQVIRAFPKFWNSVRPLTLRIASRKGEIEKVLDRLSGILPGFRRPNVCFAIGCLRTGGTTSKDLILIGSEIAASDSSVITTEFKGWLKSVIGKNGDIVSMVAHEAIHTQQSGFPFWEIFSLMKHGSLNLLNMAIVEGSCDFITHHFLGLNINRNINAYGHKHHCQLLREFVHWEKERPFDYSGWLYNGNQSKARPADLGYYIGYCVTESYYNKASNKRKALKTILKRGKYKKLYRTGGLDTISCG